jgi:hypothetical protein
LAWKALFHAWLDWRSCALIVRDEKMPTPSAPDKPDPMRPTKQITVNYVPAPYPNYSPAIIKMKPGECQV